MVECRYAEGRSQQGGGEGGCLRLEAAPEAAVEGFCQVGGRHQCVEEGGSAPEGP